jgi:hypothetical protein
MLSKTFVKDRRVSAFKKGRALITQTWESQLTLSIFLGLLVLTVFLIPVLGLERPYGRFSRDLISRS